MRHIVINKSNGDRLNGGFSLSHKAWLRLRELGQSDALAEPDAAAHWADAAGAREPSLNRCSLLIARDDHKLVQVVRELGEAANGHCAELKIVEIPDDVAWQIENHGGIEHVSEKHRTWY